MGPAIRNPKMVSSDAGCDGRPERGIDLAASERRALHDRIAQSLVDEQLAQRHEDSGQGNEAEVFGLQRVGQDREDHERQQLGAPRIDKGPGQPARHAALKPTGLRPMLAGHPVSQEISKVPRASKPLEV